MDIESVDITVLIITAVLTVLLIFANLYFVAYYSHNADSKFGNSIISKGILVSNFNVLPFLRWSAFSWLNLKFC